MRRLTVLRSLSTLGIFSTRVFIHTYNLRPVLESSPLLKFSTMNPSAPDVNEVLIDRKQFDQINKIVSLSIPAKSSSLFMKNLEPYLFNFPRMKRIYPDITDPNRRILLLSSDIKDLNLPDIPDDLKSFIKEADGVVQFYELMIGYDQLAVDDILKQLLPNTLKEIPSSFEQAGHVAHLNLREEALPYKHIIGQVLLDKNPAIKTVVNKISSISNEFRTFPLEVLAGENDLNISLKESGALFKFNFAEVYWNSRLQKEHSRLIDMIRDSSYEKKLESNKEYVVADMMTGIGPFSVPMTMQSTVVNENRKTEKKSETENETEKNKKLKNQGRRQGNLIVFANDLNPASFKYLKQNAQLNQCKNRLVPFNMDGRDFILNLLEESKQGKPPFDEAIMNLPQSAMEFLDVFIGLATRLGESFDAVWKRKLPRINVYCFASYQEQLSTQNQKINEFISDFAKTDKSAAEKQLMLDVTRRAARILRCEEKLLTESSSCSSPTVGHIVRDVAPKKIMYCLSFTLPLEVALSEPLKREEMGSLEDRWDLDFSSIFQDSSISGKKRPIEEI